MCVDPVTAALVVGGVKAGSTLFAAIDEQDAAKSARADALNQIERTRQALHHRFDDIQARKVQETIAAGRQSQEASIDAAKARGSARAASASAGVGGVSTEAMVREIYAIEGRNERDIALNLEFGIDALQNESAVSGARATHQIDKITASIPDTSFDFLGTGLQIAGDMASAYIKSQ